MNIAEALLKEEDLIRKFEIMYYLQKKEAIFFNTTSMIKAEILRMFLEDQKIEGIDISEMLTLSLIYTIKRIDSPQEKERMKENKLENIKYIQSLGFSEKFAKNATYYKEGDVPEEERTIEEKLLDIFDQFVYCSAGKGNTPSDNYVKYTNSNMIIDIGDFGYIGYLTIRIAGRINSIDYSTANQTLREQLYRIVEFGELSSTKYNFENCTNLVGPLTTPSSLSFYNVTSFTNLYKGCSNLTGSLSDDLFINAYNATSFSGAFYNCSNLTGSIPENLFYSCESATDFSSLFFECRGLTGSITGNLFSTCSNVTTFNRTFYNCRGLTLIESSNLFNGCTNVTDFTQTFGYCINLRGYAPALWLISNVNYFSNCFVSCNSLSNYLLIPNNWKGINPGGGLDM